MTNRDRAIFGAAWTLILAGIAVILILAIHPMSAAAATRPASWQQRTCAAFTAWEGHDSQRNLQRLVTDAFKVPGWGKAGLASDVMQLASDIAGAGPESRFVSDDETYLYEDCHDGSGL